MKRIRKILKKKKPKHLTKLVINGGEEENIKTEPNSFHRNIMEEMKRDKNVSFIFIFIIFILFFSTYEN